MWLTLSHTHSHSLSLTHPGRGGDLGQLCSVRRRAGDSQILPNTPPRALRLSCVQLVEEGLTRGGKRLRAGRMPPVVPLPTPLGLPQGPRHAPTVGSWAATVSYEQGTPVREGKGRSESGSLLSLSLSLSLTHTPSHSLSLAHTPSHSLSLSLSHPLTLSLSHTHATGGAGQRGR